MMECILILACWIIWPVLCYNLAQTKRHNTGNAIFAGIVFGIFAVLYYATIKPREDA